MLEGAVTYVQNNATLALFERRVFTKAHTWAIYCVPFINFQAANTALVNIQVLREKWKSKAESYTGYRNWGKC